MALISTKKGLEAKGGAKGVGRATTESVIVCLLFILMIDLIVTYLQT